MESVFDESQASSQVVALGSDDFDSEDQLRSRRSSADGRLLLAQDSSSADFTTSSGSESSSAVKKLQTRLHGSTHGRR